MREQTGFPRQPGQGQRIPQRQSLVPQRPRVPQRQSLVPQQPRYRAPASEDIEEDERYYTNRQPTSAIRYRTTTGEQVIQQGNKRFIVHQQPARQRQLPPPQQPYEEEPEPWQGTHRQARVHPLVFIGGAMLLMLVGWMLVTMAGNWWQITQDDWHYGRPRTFQIDAVVGHNDSQSSPSHFIAVNMDRHILIIELPGGDPSKAVVYTGPILMGDGQDLTPVTLSFKDVRGDGKPYMFVHILDQIIPFVNDQGKFRPAKPGEADAVAT